MSPDLDLFRQLLEQFDLAFGRTGQLYNVGFRLFTVLAIIELAWAGLLYANSYKDGEGALTDLARRAFMIMLAFAVWRYQHLILRGLFTSFEAAGLYAMGRFTASPVEVAQILNPSYILETGLSLGSIMLISSNWIPLPDELFLIPAFIVVIAFGIIAALVLITLLEAMLAIGTGAFFLAFGATRWTVGVAGSFISYAWSIAVRLFLLTVILGVARFVVEQWISTLSNIIATLTNPIAVLVPAIGSITLVVVVLAVPRIAARLSGNFTIVLGPSPRHLGVDAHD